MRRAMDSCGGILSDDEQVGRPVEASTMEDRPPLHAEIRGGINGLIRKIRTQRAKWLGAVAGTRVMHVLTFGPCRDRGYDVLSDAPCVRFGSVPALAARHEVREHAACSLPAQLPPTHPCHTLDVAVARRRIAVRMKRQLTERTTALLGAIEPEQHAGPSSEVVQGRESFPPQKPGESKAIPFTDMGCELLGGTDAAPRQQQCVDDGLRAERKVRQKMMQLLRHCSRLHPAPLATQQCDLAAPICHRQEAAQKVMTTILDRSEEHTSELQSHHDLVCRLLLEKKKKQKKTKYTKN